MDEKISQRVTDLELNLMHLQNDFESINEMVLKQGRQLDELSLLVRRMADQLESSQDDDNSREPEDEKPPHY